MQEFGFHEASSSPCASEVIAQFLYASIVYLAYLPMGHHLDLFAAKPHKLAFLLSFATVPPKSPHISFITC